MTLTLVRYDHPRRIEEYLGQSGPEVGGLALPPYAYEAIAQAKTTGLPTQYIVIGERRDQSRRYLELAVDRAWVEATTHYRQDERGFLRWTCPECGRKSGQHSKVCGWEL